jgi:hypothetical protein
MQSHDIRRHRDGAIDFDFYRAQAAALRSQAMREAFKFKATFKFVLITLALIMGGNVAASAPTNWL